MIDCLATKFYRLAEKETPTPQLIFQKELLKILKGKESELFYSYKEKVSLKTLTIYFQVLSIQQ